MQPTHHEYAEHEERGGEEECGAEYEQDEIGGDHALELRFARPHGKGHEIESVHAVEFMPEPPSP